MSTVAPPAPLVATDAHEGPVAVAAEAALYFTSLPDRARRSAVRRLSLHDGRLSTVRAGTAAANGMALASDGRLLVCEQGSFEEPARVAVLDRRTGAAHTVVDAVDGVPLNSPNDVVAGPDGAFWFTDPSYGFLQGFRPRPQRGDDVLRHDPATGTTATVADGFDKPNGLVFSPDGRTLYVGDSERHRIEAFAVEAGGRLIRRGGFAVDDPVGPDGLEADRAGRLFACGSRGVHVLAPDGAPLALLAVPGAVHLAWSGPRRDGLFVTADTAIWTVSTTHLPEA